MNTRFSLFIVLLSTHVAFAYEIENKPHNAWSKLIEPTEHFAEPIGSYANGCLAGGQPLAATGTGYIDMRRHRNRFYGHPDLLTFIYDLGEHIDNMHDEQILIGDMSQARGGKMNFGHTSHRIGLDVDIWFQSYAKGTAPNPMRDMQTIVNKAEGYVQPNALTLTMRDALFYSAQHARVARIFVNPIIKAHLCNSEDDTRWLQKLRPWWGHDQHFHVRLRCPDDAEHCKNQNPPPAGDGCNNSLYNWVQEQSDLVTGRKKPKKSKGKPRVRILPELCENIRLYTLPKQDDN